MAATEAPKNGSYFFAKVTHRVTVTYPMAAENVTESMPWLWSQDPSLLLTSYVALEKLCNLSVPLFSILIQI